MVIKGRKDSKDDTIILKYRNPKWGPVCQTCQGSVVLLSIEDKYILKEGKIDRKVDR